MPPTYAAVFGSAARGSIADGSGAEPVLRDVLNDGFTVAGTRAWLDEQLRKAKV